MIPDAGHSAKASYSMVNDRIADWFWSMQEPGIQTKLIEVCDDYRNL
jgi:hypothetical protein